MYRGVLLIQLQKGKPLMQLRSRRLGIAAETLQHRVICLHSFREILLSIGDLSQVELGASGQIVHGIVMNHILKLARGD